MAEVAELAVLLVEGIAVPVPDRNRSQREYCQDQYECEDSKW
jgi:hypothetical protein